MKEFTHLSTEEKTTIKILKGIGISINKIGKSLNRHPSTVCRYLKACDHNQVEKRGRKCLLKDRTLRQIKRLVNKMPVSANFIKNSLKIKASNETVRKAMIKMNLKWKDMELQVPFTKQHIEKRIAFAELHLTLSYDWKTVVFSDEKCFSLLGPVHKLKCWSDKLHKHVLRYDRHQGGHISVWGAIGYDFKTPLVIIKGYLKSEQYIEILENNLLPYIRNFTVYQQDNAPQHVSKLSKEWFNTNNIDVLNWPPRSPDLNIIENCWGLLTNKLYKHGTQFNTKASLISCLLQEWNNMDQTVIQNLFHSIPKRLLDCIKLKGNLTKY